ncbi:pilus assembly FimT family protein [Hydrogenimonas sp.]
MKRGFTLIELIFVILLVGLLGAVGTSLYKPDRVLSDTRFIAAKLMKSRYLAIGYDHRNFDGTFRADRIGCVTLDRSGLEDGVDEAGGYRLGTTTQITVDGMAGNTICFDEKGYPHDGDFSAGSLLHRKVDITVSGSGKSYRITLFPVSGYATIVYR